MTKTSKDLVRSWAAMEDDRRSRVEINQIGSAAGDVRYKRGDVLIGKARKEHGNVVIRYRTNAASISIGGHKIHARLSKFAKAGTLVKPALRQTVARSRRAAASLP